MESLMRVHLVIWLAMLAASFISYMPSPLAGSELQLVHELADWQSLAGKTESLATDSQSLTLADEIATPPALGSDLGHRLTFPRENTGLAHSFWLENLQVPATLPRGLVYRDNRQGLNGDRNISVGEADGLAEYPQFRDKYEDDDFEVRLIDGGPVTAFGFWLVGNQDNRQESLSVFLGDRLVASTTQIPRTGQSESVFMGVISNEPFDRVVFNDDYNLPTVDGDDIAVRDFFFSVPEPRHLDTYFFGFVMILRIASMSASTSNNCCRIASC
jgi:hypothetical protein